MNSTSLTVETYAPLAMRTAKVYPTFEMNLIHASLGIGSEMGEFSEGFLFSQDPVEKYDALLEELGDLLWFNVYAQTCIHIAFDPLGAHPSAANRSAAKFTNLGYQPEKITGASVYGTSVHEYLMRHTTASSH